MKEMESFIGKRLGVYGPTGCGKPSLGTEAAHRLGLSHLDLDVPHWIPGWRGNTRGQFRADVVDWLDARPGR